MDQKTFKKCAKKIATSLKDMPREWDGKESIIAMKEGGSRHWRQMEWIGFYFEFLCQQRLSTGSKPLLVQNDAASYGKTNFDGFYIIPWDYKTHATNTSGHMVIVNDREAIETAVADHGSVGVILAIGDVVYNDEDGSFQRWHSALKGETSEYEKERKKRGTWSRLRKTRFTLKQILFVQVNKSLLKRTGSFQAGFRNAGGQPRRDKVRLDLEDLRETDYYDLPYSHS